MYEGIGTVIYMYHKFTFTNFLPFFLQGLREFPLFKNSCFSYIFQTCMFSMDFLLKLYFYTSFFAFRRLVKFSFSPFIPQSFSIKSTKCYTRFPFFLCFYNFFVNLSKWVSLYLRADFYCNLTFSN